MYRPQACNVYVWENSEKSKQTAQPFTSNTKQQQMSQKSISKILLMNELNVRSNSDANVLTSKVFSTRPLLVYYYY